MKTSKKYSLISIMVLAIAALCAFAPKKGNESLFVKVKETHFEVGGKPYYFVGMNMWYGAYLGSAKMAGGRERLKKELDFMKKNGITNIRLLGASEKSVLVNSIKQAIQEKPGVYNEDLLKGLDFVLAEMGKRGMYAVIYLNNFWQWSGGMSQYQGWTNKSKVIDPDAGDSWNDFMAQSASFYYNEAAQEAYRAHIKKLVNRQNTINKKLYKNDPTIMAWQLANEPRPGSDGENSVKNRSVFVKWVDQTAAYIHSIDPNHLVTTGSEGKAGSNQDESLFVEAHSSKNIDYATFHLWIKNWGWYKCDKAEETYPEAEKKAVNYIQTHIDLAKKLNKPITMEEFGVDRDNCSLVPGSACTFRDKYFAKVYSIVEENMKSGAPLAGTNVWAWGGLGEPMKEQKNVKAINFVGDPFCEPQGLNSVFAKDESTMELIRKHAASLLAK